MHLRVLALPTCRWALVASVFAVTGCAPLASREGTLPDTPVPAAWSRAGARPGQQSADLTAWWQRFGDVQLIALIDRALHANTDMRSARAALRQARALRDVRAAGLWPQADASASAQRSRAGYAPAGNSFTLGLDASWEPDVWSGNRSALAAAEADAQAAAAALAQVQVALAGEVAVTYIELRGLQARLAIARNNLASQTETLQIARWRAQAGLASSLDVEQAVAAAEQTRAQIPALDTSLAQALHSLDVLTARPLGIVQKQLRDAPVPQAADDLALAIPAETLRQRPDVRAAEHRVSAALARVVQADAARYPSLRISGSVGLRALTLGSLTQGASVANALLASVSVPLFDAGAARAQVRVQDAALEQARVAYEATVLNALKDVEDALVALQGNRARLGHLQAAADAAANADLLARQRYASGLIDFRSVLDTQRTLLSTQDGVESTRASLSADHVRLYKALGGGWSSTTQETIDAP